MFIMNMSVTDLCGFLDCVSHLLPFSFWTLFITKCLEVQKFNMELQSQAVISSSGIRYGSSYLVGHDN
jgi:hypothetical protein